eukprot:TRINITY_DN2052_c0_g3_i1.p1 TRINITY_DN2052_c0_g3~~TRINITY_DN2052_c0_g3_i1.p1  ORF type:complete len:220 (-),score=41.59 TRINITY_DN2052_c0_g3_i1:136-795(-)
MCIRDRYMGRPLTINSGKSAYGRSPYCGNLRAPIKATCKPALATQYAPTRTSGQKFIMGGVASEAFAGSSAAHDRRFPAELRLGLIGQEKESSWYRNVITSESKRNHPKPLLPKLEIDQVIPEEHKQPIGGKFSPTEHSNVSKRVATAQVKKEERARLRSQQGEGGRRPESRYNKESLYMKLDHGRASSPEYKVPILDMNFAEMVGRQIVPDCWKQDPI